MNFKFFSALALIGLLQNHAVQATATFKVGGYYENWAFWRTPGKWSSNMAPCTYPGSASPNGFVNSTNPTGIANNIDYFNYAFALFNYNNQTKAVTGDWKVYYSDPADDPNWLSIINQMKQQNPQMKVMLSLGGWNFCQNGQGAYGSDTYTFFSEMTANANNNINDLIASLINPTNGYLLLKNGNCGYLIDGIDLDWEYPGQVSGDDYANYIIFITALRSEIRTLNSGARNTAPCYISMAIPPFMPAGIKEGSFLGNAVTPNNPSTYFAFIANVAESCDWVNLMTYDMYGAFPGQSTIQFQAPLYNGKFVAGYTPQSTDATTVPSNTNNEAFSIAYALWMYTTGGSYSGFSGTTVIPASKILLGLPAYGRVYGNTTPFSTEGSPIGATYTGVGAPQTYSQQAGVAAYYEILNQVAQGTYIGNLTGGSTLALGDDDASVAQSYFIANNTKLTPPNNVYVYDSVADFQSKIAYAQAQGLGGVFLYPLTMDALTGVTTYDFTNSLLTNGITNPLTDNGETSSGVSYTERSPN